MKEDNTPDTTEPTAKPELIRLYMYQPWEIAQKIIRENRLKATLPLQTNDPFECMPRTPEDWQSEDYIVDRDSGFAYICFTRSITSAAMWGHYADRHKGVCLVFEFPVVQTTALGIPGWKITGMQAKPEAIYSLLPVNYDGNRVQYQTSDIASIATVMTTKDQSWSFEQEVRCICGEIEADSAEDGNIYYGKLMPYLKGIVLGTRFPHSANYVKIWLRPYTTVWSAPIKVVRGKYNPIQFKIDNPEWKDTAEHDFGTLDFRFSEE